MPVLDSCKMVITIIRGTSKNGQKQAHPEDERPVPEEVLFHENYLLTKKILRRSE